MKLILATHYSVGDATWMMSMMTMPSLIVIITTLFSFVVWKKRKEIGFLVLAIGMAAHMLGVCIPAIFLWQGKDAWTVLGRFVWVLQLPALISLVGWGLLAKNTQANA